MIIRENYTHYMTVLDFAYMMEDIEQPLAFFGYRDSIPIFEGTVRDMKGGRRPENLELQEDWEIFLNSNVIGIRGIKNNVLLLTIDMSSGVDAYYKNLKN